MATSKKPKVKATAREIVLTPESAAALIGSTAYSMDNADELARVFLLIHDQSQEAITKDNCMMLVQAVFDRSRPHADAFERYVKTLRSQEGGE